MMDAVSVWHLRLFMTKAHTRRPPIKSELINSIWKIFRRGSIPWRLLRGPPPLVRALPVTPERRNIQRPGHRRPRHLGVPASAPTQAVRNRPCPAENGKPARHPTDAECPLTAAGIPPKPENQNRRPPADGRRAASRSRKSLQKENFPNKPRPAPRRPSARVLREPYKRPRIQKKPADSRTPLSLPA